MEGFKERVDGCSEVEIDCVCGEVREVIGDDVGVILAVDKKADCVESVVGVDDESNDEEVEDESGIATGMEFPP